MLLRTVNCTVDTNHMKLVVRVMLCTLHGMNYFSLSSGIVGETALDRRVTMAGLMTNQSAASMALRYTQIASTNCKLVDDSHQYGHDADDVFSLS